VGTYNFWERFGVNLMFVSVGLVITVLGPKWIGYCSKFFALAVIIPMILFTGFCFTHERADPKRWLKTTDDKYVIIDGLRLYSSVLLWLYSGYDYSGFLADETKTPTVTYPRALIVSVVFTMFVYLLPMAAALAVTNDPDEYTTASFTKIANILGRGEWLGYTLIGGALFSNLGVYLVYIHTSSNALCALAEKGDAPAIFAKKLKRFNTPWVAVVFYSISTQFWSTFNFTQVVEVDTVLYCIHVIILIATFLKLRYSAPNMDRPFRIPGSNLFLLICSIVPISIAIGNVCMTNYFEIVLSVLLMLIVITCYFIKLDYHIYKTFDD